MNLQWNSACAARHLGPWAVELKWFETAIAHVLNGIILPVAVDPSQVTAAEILPYDPASRNDGVAVIDIAGQLVKGPSKYGGTSSLWVRQALRTATRDPDVKAIMLRIDSPGGTVAGTEELAREVRKAALAKPLFAHIDDLGASAAYWVASQAYRITANETGEVGSIGTVAVLYDSSGASSARGIKVNVVSTGAFKGVGVPGAPVLPEHLEYLRGRVEDLNVHFVSAVTKARKGKLTAKAEEWADGRVWIADRARGLGLIDDVMPFDKAMSDLLKFSKTNRDTAGSIRRAEIAQAESETF